MARWTVDLAVFSGLVCGLAHAPAAEAQQTGGNPLIGFWARDADECKPEPTYAFRSGAMVGIDYTCAAARYVRRADGWTIHARSCKGDGEGITVASEMQIAARIKNRRLTLVFPDGTTSPELVKCR